MISSRSGLDGIAARAHAGVEGLAALLLLGLGRRLLLLGLLLLGLPALLPLPGAAHHRPGGRGLPCLVLAVFLLDVAVDPVVSLVLVAAHLRTGRAGGRTDGGAAQSTALRSGCRGGGWGGGL